MVSAIGCQGQPTSSVLKETQSESAQQNSTLDNRVKAFLDSHRNQWHDFNIPYQDGQELEKLVVQHQCKNILEIGTSSGHSTIWLAKAVAKTGGKVITLELDRGRHERAKKNFEAAGVAHLIDARLGDAMQLIPTLNQEFDFVFSDATWSTQPDEGYLTFFKLCDPRLKKGGLYTMHNVTDGYGDDGRFFRYLDKLGTYKTHIIRASRNGISVSVKQP